MEPGKAQEIAERDQLWASLRALLPAIEMLAAGTLGASEQQRQLIQLLARVVVSELQFRAKGSE